MFGKKYDKEIELLIKANSVILKSIESLKELFDGLQQSVLDMCKIQTQHRHLMTFLLNHASMDPDAEEDLLKMLKEIKQIEDEVKRARK